MDIGQVQSVDIDEQMRSAYLDYAMSVIVARALPDARDGLKPVHRRILYGMYDMGIRSNSSYKKSARIVGEVLGKYHPHGDSAVYDAMARLAQDFSMRYPLVDGQGNFGSIDGDAPAAMRYTEARLAQLAEEMLVDIDKDTVDFSDNFDGSLKEPTVLPSRLPNLLLNGSAGIAVGMATNIPPHNLRELSSAIAYLIDHYDQLDEVTVEELMEHVQGPDFPTGGIIVGREAIRQLYSTGRARLTVRGVATIDEVRGRQAIIISEIPYQVNKTGLIERIADLARDGKLDMVADLRDESDRRGMRIVVELKRGAQPRKVLNQLYKYTPLQTTFGAHMLALVNDEPRALSLKRALQVYVDHRVNVITRRSQFELEKARRRAHVLEGMLIALANLDEVIKTIREARDGDVAKVQLIERFQLTDVQAQAILDMQLRRLAALERQKIEDEHRETMARIADLEDLLAHPKRILEVIKEDLADLTEKYGDERRTRISLEASESFNEEDLIADEQVLITITNKGYVKRVNTRVYRSQMRGGRGVMGQTLKDNDEVLMLIPARTLHTVLFFTNRGKVYSEKVYNLPDGGRTDRGVPIVNVISLLPDEQVTAAVAVPHFGSGYLTLATRRGRVKRMVLSEFASVRPSGLIAINLDEGDELCWVRLTKGSDDIILITANGQALRFSEKMIRSMGRQAAGVTGIRLHEGDQVASMEVVQPGTCLLVVTDKGYGKRVPVEDFPVKGRATGGVRALDPRNQDRFGKVATARVVEDDDEVTLISASGIIIRIKVGQISKLSRAARGVRLMDLAEGDTVASVARLSSADITSGADGTSPGEENGRVPADELPEAEAPAAE
ncbi:MAG TPA: DNA gyrase subunit A [Chloroflexi bacterium]|nr:DNA gyrase subunit A [Chloroflexota bacterium]